MSRINLLLKESALFDRELGAGYEVGEKQSEASRARLDVLRVAFAMYSEQATMYRPFLGMVQRVSCVICVLPCWPLRFRPCWCVLAIIMTLALAGIRSARRHWRGCAGQGANYARILSRGRRVSSSGG